MRSTKTLGVYALRTGQETTARPGAARATLYVSDAMVVRPPYTASTAHQTHTEHRQANASAEMDGVDRHAQVGSTTAT
jgi:hypothetical protein